MKNQIFRSAICGVLFAALPFVAGCKEGVSSAVAEEVISNSAPNVEVVSQAEPQSSSTASAELSQVAPEKAEPAQPSVTKPLPADIRLSPSAAEIVKLAQAGVEDSVMLSFIKNANGTFNLGSEQIIYLNDLGVASPIVTAMMEHDRNLGIPQNSTPPPVVQNITPTPEPAVSADSIVTEANNYAQPAQPVVVNNFYSSLAPYGSWVDVEGYGRCWQPTVVVSRPTWRPYCDRGRWVYSDCGWYWLSDYSWGSTTFHYGRWFQHPRWGWCWYPDTVWAPAWVTWRYSNDYCGWAALPPRTGYQPGIGFTYRDRSVSVSFGFGLGMNCFTFIPINHFCESHPSRHVVPRNQVTQIYNSTVIVNNFAPGSHNTVINHGIPVERVSAATHTPIHPITIRETSVNPRNNRSERIERNGRELVVYRPPVSPTIKDGTAARNETPRTGSTMSKAVQPRTQINEAGNISESRNPNVGQRNNGEAARRQPVLPATRTENQNTPNNGSVGVITPVSRPQERREVSQPSRTDTAIQTEPITRPTRAAAPKNSLIVIGQKSQERVQTPAGSIASPTEYSTSPRASHNRSSTPQAERQESQISRPAPIISHHEPEMNYRSTVSPSRGNYSPTESAQPATGSHSQTSNRSASGSAGSQRNPNSSAGEKSKTRDQ